MMIEMECLVCGDHDFYDDKKQRNYCLQCENGLMVKFNPN